MAAREEEEEEGCGLEELVAGSQAAAADPADGSQAGVSYNTRVRHTMAHKIGLNDTQYEPADIERRGALDFSSCSSSSSRFLEGDNKDVLERTKGTTSDILVVRNNSDMVVSTYNLHLQHHSVIESSSSSSSSSLIAGDTRCLVNSRLLEDTSCGLTEQEEANNSRRCLSKVVEGRPVVVVESGLRGGGGEKKEEEEEVMRNQDRGSFGSSKCGRGTVGSANSIEAREQSLTMQAGGAVVMDPVDQRDPLLYSSDEWEESELSDTDSDDDHSDSSDDDDPKSQVDRLIERGTLMYMDGENSNLSSEAESSDDDSSSGDDDSDSESDITDVSPLISATASPLGLSPVLPRRTLGTSPLALHDNRDLAVLDYRPEISSNDQGYDSQPHCNGSGHSNSDDSTDMTLLLKAVVELEKKQHKRHHNNHHHNNQHNNRHYNQHHNNHHHQLNQQNNQHHHHHHHLQEPTSPITIHPIDASPHHSHLRKASHSHRRKNMSFSNDEVRRIDRENQILLHKIMSAHTKNQSSSNHNNRTVQRPANSTVNRKREEEKIRRENMILLRKIQEAKPSRDVTASRSPRHRTTPSVRPPSSLPAAPGSCGASARSA